MYSHLKLESLDNSLLDNYRPICLLSLLLKPVEKHSCKAALHHLDCNKLPGDSQSGCRPKCSCHTVVTNMIENLQNISEDNTCGGVFIDYKKAFYMIDHVILIYKLETARVNVNLIMLIKCFLLKRQQIVAYNKSRS